MTDYKQLYENQKEENINLQRVIHTFVNEYKRVIDDTDKKLDKILKKNSKGGKKVIGKIFAFIAGFFTGTIFGHLAVGIIIEWIKTKGGLI